MQEEMIDAIQVQLASTVPAELARGLERVRAAAPAASVEERRRLYEMVEPLFYIDTLDHPEHMPVVEEAIATVAGLGDEVIPILVHGLEAGDLKAEMAIAQALGRMGEAAIDPLIEQYGSACPDIGCRAFLLYALGKIKSPAIVKAAGLAAEAAASPDLELRDTAVRAIGKFVESIPAGSLPDDVRALFLARLEPSLGDVSPGIRAKAVRSLGKLARYGHLTGEQRAALRTHFHRILGDEADFEWDRAYIVRKEAKEALAYVS